MKRSEFLAIIPSLSAIPFIGKDIVRKSDRIEIFQPEEVKDYTDFISEHTEVHIVKKGKVLAKGFITQISAEAPLHGPTHIDGSFVITTPLTNEAHNAFHDIVPGHFRYSTENFMNQQYDGFIP